MQKFAPNADYNMVLNRLKTDFDRKWKDTKPSTADQLKDYEDIKVLGSGAFGVVVSFFPTNPFYQRSALLLSTETR